MAAVISSIFRRHSRPPPVDPLPWNDVIW